MFSPTLQGNHGDQHKMSKLLSDISISVWTVALLLYQSLHLKHFVVSKSDGFRESREHDLQPQISGLTWACFEPLLQIFIQQMVSTSTPVRRASAALSSFCCSISALSRPEFLFCFVILKCEVRTAVNSIFQLFMTSHL